MANGNANSVTELSASTGALVRVFSASSYGFSGPRAVSSDGTHVWVANDLDSVTELSASTGALVQVISTPSDGFHGPAAVSSDGTHVWVVNYGEYKDPAGTVTELSASTGALVEVISGSRYGFNQSRRHLLGRDRRLGGERRGRVRDCVPDLRSDRNGPDGNQFTS